MFCYLQIKLSGCECFYVTREIVSLQEKYNTFKSGGGEKEETGMKGVHIISGLSSTTISIWQVPDFPAPRKRPRSEKRTAHTCHESTRKLVGLRVKCFRIFAF